jgi:16S rRNA (uracil1498-N3)-methyltransferase
MARNKHTAEERFFYHSNPDPDKVGVGVFDEAESGHIARVLRMQPGDEISITNGLGILYKAKISDANPKRCRFEITESVNHEQPRPSLHLGVALTKNADRLEWALEKCVEIGVQRFTPLITRRTERNHLNEKRLHQIAISALKQSRQCWLPEVDAPAVFNDFVQTVTDTILIAHCMENTEVLTLQDALKQDKTARILLIGPEGDFTEEEVALALSMGGKAVKFSTPRLRTETAAVYGCAVYSTINS